MNNTLTIILPAIITILGNIIFYMTIKKKIDNSIEITKIAYSGIFKERIEIYKELLSKIYHLKLKIQRYQYFGTDDDAQVIFKDFETFINFYLTNQPFLSKKIISLISKLRGEFQEVFDSFFLFHNVGKNSSENEERKKIIDDYFKSGNKFKTDHFKEIEETIIVEMRKDLKTDKS